MTRAEASVVWERFADLLAEAESAIDCARRNIGRANGYYSTDPQLREARHRLTVALELLPQVEIADQVLA